MAAACATVTLHGIPDVTRHILILAALLATPATAQTPPTDPVTVMARVMAAFAGIEKTPDQVMDAFLPEAKQSNLLITPIKDLPAGEDDPRPSFFETNLPGDDPSGMNGAVLSWIRFGPSTLASANDTIKGMGRNARLGLRASDPLGDPSVQIRLMLGVMPYRPFDDTTLPAFGLELRAATRLFAPPS